MQNLLIAAILTTAPSTVMEKLILFKKRVKKLQQIKYLSDDKKLYEYGARNFNELEIFFWIYFRSQSIKINTQSIPDSALLIYS